MNANMIAAIEDRTSGEIIAEAEGLLRKGDIDAALWKLHIAKAALESQYRHGLPKIDFVMTQVDIGCLLVIASKEANDSRALFGHAAHILGRAKTTILGMIAAENIAHQISRTDKAEANETIPLAARCLVNLAAAQTGQARIILKRRKNGNKLAQWFYEQQALSKCNAAAANIHTVRKEPYASLKGKDFPVWLLTSVAHSLVKLNQDLGRRDIAADLSQIAENLLSRRQTNYTNAPACAMR